MLTVRKILNNIEDLFFPFSLYCLHTRQDVLQPWTQAFGGMALSYRLAWAEMGAHAPGSRRAAWLVWAVTLVPTQVSLTSWPPGSVSLGWAFPAEATLSGEQHSVMSLVCQWDMVVTELLISPSCFEGGIGEHT